MKSKPPSAQVADVRTPTERALAESQATYFKGLMDQPEFGYKSEFERFAPLRERKRTEFRKDIGKYGAERGFGALGNGMQADLFARGVQEMGEQEEAAEAANKQAYRDWVIGGGRTAATPTGRTAFMQPGRPSAFSQLAGPILGGVGAMFGGGLGAGLGTGFGSLFGGDQRGYSGTSDVLRSQQPQDEGFRSGFGRGWRGYFRPA